MPAPTAATTLPTGLVSRPWAEVQATHLGGDGCAVCTDGFGTIPERLYVQLKCRHTYTRARNASAPAWPLTQEAPKLPAQSAGAPFVDFYGQMMSRAQWGLGQHSGGFVGFSVGNVRNLNNVASA